MVHAVDQRQQKTQGKVVELEEVNENLVDKLAEPLKLTVRLSNSVALVSLASIMS